MEQIEQHKIEKLFTNPNTRLCRSTDFYGLNLVYFIADNENKKVLKDISKHKFNELMDNFNFVEEKTERGVTSYKLEKIN